MQTYEWFVDIPARRTALAGCAREGHLQARTHGVPLSGWTSTSVPRRSHHPSHKSHLHFFKNIYEQVLFGVDSI